MTNELERAGLAVVDHAEAEPTPLAFLEQRVRNRRVARAATTIVVVVVLAASTVAIAALSTQHKHAVVNVGPVTPACRPVAHPAVGKATVYNTWEVVEPTTGWVTLAGEFSDVDGVHVRIWHVAAPPSELSLIAQAKQEASARGCVAMPPVVQPSEWPAEGALVKDSARGDIVLVIDDQGVVRGRADNAPAFPATSGIEPFTLSITGTDVRFDAPAYTTPDEVDPHVHLPDLGGGLWTALIPSPDGKYYLAQHSGACGANGSYLVNRATGHITDVSGQVVRSDMSELVSVGWWAPHTALITFAGKCLRADVIPGLFAVASPGAVPSLVFPPLDNTRPLSVAAFRRADAPATAPAPSVPGVTSPGVASATTVVVPDVIGMKISVASKALIDLGFVIHVSGQDRENPAAVVSSQTAVPGSVAERGAVVDLSVGLPLPVDG